MISDNRQSTQITQYIRKARKIYFFTGAGISTDSGIPDFRGPKGVWKTRQPVYYDDFMSSEKSRIDYWDYKLEWWENNRDAKPNSIHKAIVDLEKAGKVLMVVTQNIDGLHRLAGTSAKKIIELHGTNWKIECQTCLKRSEPGAHFDYFKSTGKAPVCDCSGFLKPATISFGQQLVEEDMEKAHEVSQQADCVIALGSTLSVYPAANFPLEAAKRGVPYIIINIGRTEHDNLAEVSLRIETSIGDIFPQAVKEALR